MANKSPAGKMPSMAIKGAPGGQKAKNFKKSLGKLLIYIKPFLPMIIISVLLAIGGTILTIYAPKYLTKISKLLELKSYTISQIGELCIYFLLIIVSGVFLSIIQNFIMANINARICRKLRGEISEKTNRLPLSYFDNNTYGDILSRITNDVDTISFNLNSSITTLITSIVTIIAVPAFMFTISWELTLLAIGSIPITIVLALIVVKFSQKYFREQQKSLGLVNGQIEEVYSAQQIVKVYNGQKRENQKFEKTNSKLYKSAYKSQFLGGILHPIMGMVTNFSYVLCCVVSAILIINGRYNAIAFIAQIPIFLTYIRQFNNPLHQLSNISSSLQSTVAASERVFEFLDEKEQEDESSKTAKIDDFSGKVEFKHVKFGYTEDKVIIKDLSFVAYPGQKIAIVGPTGAGKTTIVNLLMRFYDYNEGEILIDGVNIKDLKREDVRSKFAMVLQDTWLFDGTIRENLMYGNSSATEKDIISACKASNIWHFIGSLPDGLNHYIDEKSSLSAGQRQLFTIARAMVQNSSMLILDEATSSVDTRTEEIIAEAMDNLSKGKTSFVIAHRLSTIKNADLILLLKDGDVVEQGTHQELLAKNGSYAELYNSQFLIDNN